jgi:transcriptional regulator with XRE-family HTH domain
MDFVKIGKTFQVAREEQGLTQAEVAKKATLSTNWYARFERGEETASVKTIKKIAKALNIKSLDILS